MVARRRLGPAALAFSLALVLGAPASADVVARGVRDGLLALDAKGAPYVAYVRGKNLVVSQRTANGRWRPTKVDAVSPGSQVMAFEVGASGPVVLVLSADNKRLVLVRRQLLGWQSIRLNARLASRGILGWPGLALDRKGSPVVAYTRWNSVTFNSQLLLARLDARGRVNNQRITAEGFPQSYVPPPAEPVLVGGRVHVIESYGYRGTVGTLEWFPQKRTWTGFGLDAGVGDYPIGPVFGGVGRDRLVHAAWTESLLSEGYSEAPVTLATRGRVSESEFILNRALTTGLAIPASGPPEVAANEWMSSDDVGLQGSKYLWAGTIVRGESHVELDGWIAGLAVAPRGARDVLLVGRSGLLWFRSPRRLGIHVTIEAADQPNGMVEVSGRVSGVASGTVALYRERPGETRMPIGRKPLVGGSFSFVDRPTVRPVLYRAIYTDPSSGIPYAALLRQAVVSD
jgi:hypothetical protein